MFGVLRKGAKEADGEKDEQTVLLLMLLVIQSHACEESTFKEKTLITITFLLFFH